MTVLQEKEAVMVNDYIIHPARMDEYKALEALMAASVRSLGADYYTAQAIEASLMHLFGLDSELISDGTYFAVMREEKYLACGGWSRRRTLYGGDRYVGRASGLLDPRTEAAKIRAFYVHPDYARQGIATALLRHCEAEAIRSGFLQMEMMATLSGVPFYAVLEYRPGEQVMEVLADGTAFPLVPMYKTCHNLMEDL